MKKINKIIISIITFMILTLSFTSTTFAWAKGGNATIANFDLMTDALDMINEVPEGYTWIMGRNGNGTLYLIRKYSFEVMEWEEVTSTTMRLKNQTNTAIYYALEDDTEWTYTPYTLTLYTADALSGYWYANNDYTYERYSDNEEMEFIRYKLFANEEQLLQRSTERRIIEQTNLDENYRTDEQTFWETLIDNFESLYGINLDMSDFLEDTKTIIDNIRTWTTEFTFSTIPGITFLTDIGEWFANLNDNLIIDTEIVQSRRAVLEAEINENIPGVVDSVAILDYFADKIQDLDSSTVPSMTLPNVYEPITGTKIINQTTYTFSIMNEQPYSILIATVKLLTTAILIIALVNFTIKTVDTITRY